MQWMAKNLRGKTVWARVDESGTLVRDNNGRVEIIYKKTPGAKIYRAAERNLEAAESNDIIEFDVSSPVAPHHQMTEPLVDQDAIIIYTDGACSGNPGPMGIGAVVIDNGNRHEISEYLGKGTNNIAELTAILRALESLPSSATHRSVRVHTDSSYAIGLLTKGWKAKANQELVATVRSIANNFPHLRMVKVKGHAGIPENERADQLAVEGAQAGR